MAVLSAICVLSIGNPLSVVPPTSSDAEWASTSMKGIRGIRVFSRETSSSLFSVSSGSSSSFGANLASFSTAYRIASGQTRTWRRWVIALAFFCFHIVNNVLSKAGSNEKPTRVLLISDPQLPNPRRSGTSWFGYGASSTRYLRKGWSVVTRLHPHAIVWLGDMLASGRYVTSDDEYVSS